MTFLHGTSILFVIIQKPTLVSKDLKRMYSLLYDVLVNEQSRVVRARKQIFPASCNSILTYILSQFLSFNSQLK